MKGRVRILLWKEWAELSQRKMLVAGTILPSIIFLGVAFAVALVAMAIPESSPNNKGFPPGVLEPLRRLSPALATLSPVELSALFLIRQMMLFMLLAPVMSAMSVATHSVIGEKTNRSLEPLLTTPLTTFELLLGKCLAAAIPAITLSWVTATLYAAGIRLIVPPGLFAFIFDATAVWLVLLMAPLVAVLGLGLGVVASSWATDPRSAQQIGALIVVPFIAAFLGQLQGMFFLTPPLVVAAAIVLGGIDVLVLLVGVRLFRRETILTRWK